MLKKLFYFVMFIAMCWASDAYGATFEDSYPDQLIAQAWTPDDKTVEKSDFVESSNSITGNIQQENTGIPWYQSVLVLLGVLLFFVLFCKHTWLVLELTNYNHWLFLHQRYNDHGRPHYPGVNPWMHLFNFKHWRLKDVIDPFTFQDYQKWSNEQTKKVFMGDSIK